MIPEAAAWAIFFLPLASFVIIGLVIRPFFNRYDRVSGYLTVIAIGGSLVLSAWALRSVMGREEAIGWPSHTWLTLGVGPALDVGVGIYLDSLTGIMLVVVSGVSLMVQIYSQGYMRGDPGYSRYFAFMSLFTASMLGLVMARNIVQLYLFWELVGVCSYLLIGFWYHRPAAAAAAKKAFIVTRIGDFGFLIALLYLFFQRQTFQDAGLNPLEIPDIHEAAVMGLLGAGVVTWIATGIFAGAVGKSAQVPLHVWLPDAMEGPTPVSALIHAATMVAAGVFLVARFFPLYLPDPTVAGMTAPMILVALVGGITAIFAASMGLVMHDIKRVLAYSTVSQLGYMMLALGVGAYDAAMFHLFTHAFFKALLFLGAGSVNHATGTFDMRYMGGLRRHMPWTYATFLVASLSLAGFPFLAGWWSKDEILAHAFGQGAVGQLVYWLGLITVFMTAFYIFRAVHLTFHGQFRGGVDAEEGVQETHRAHLAESPLVMVVPMALLAVPSVLAGFVANPPFGLGPVPGHWFAHTLVSPQEVLLHIEAEVEGIDALAVVSTLVALAGIGLSYLMYYTRQVSPEGVAARIRPVYQLVYRRYYFDELYEGAVVARGFYRGFALAWEWFDSRIVDGLVNNAGWFSRNVGRVIATLQTGQVQAYGVGISLGIVLILVAFLIWG